MLAEELCGWNLKLMKNADWNTILGKSSLFSSLNEVERARLLDEAVSVERDCPEGAIILREGEAGDTVFLIGSGAVGVALIAPDGQKILLYTLREGDFFGEMALLENKPRSASVTARARCVLLEIKGQEILKLMRKHHEITIHILREMSERLRHTGEEILKLKLKGLDETIKYFDEKLDATVDANNAKLAASQSIFDQINQRAHEIIESADRARTRLTVAASTVGAIIAAVTTLSAYFGYSEFTSTRNEIVTVKDEIVTMKETVVGTAATASEASKTAEKQADVARKEAEFAKENADQLKTQTETTLTNLKELEKKIGETSEDMEKFREWQVKSLLASFPGDVEKSRETAVETFKTTLRISGGNAVDELFTAIQSGIIGKEPARENYAISLKYFIDENIAESSRDSVLFYYHLLVSLVLNGEDIKTLKDGGTVIEYDKLLKDYEEFIKAEEGRPIKNTLDQNVQKTYIARAKDDTQKKRDIEKLWNLIP